MLMYATTSILCAVAETGRSVSSSKTAASASFLMAQPSFWIGYQCKGGARRSLDCWGCLFAYSLVAARWPLFVALVAGACCSSRPTDLPVGTAGSRRYESGQIGSASDSVVGIVSCQRDKRKVEPGRRAGQLRIPG